MTALQVPQQYCWSSPLTYVTAMSISLISWRCVVQTAISNQLGRKENVKNSKCCLNIKEIVVPRTIQIVWPKRKRKPIMIIYNSIQKWPYYQSNRSTLVFISHHFLFDGKMKCEFFTECDKVLFCGTQEQDILSPYSLGGPNRYVQGITWMCYVYQNLPKKRWSHKKKIYSINPLNFYRFLLSLFKL